MWINMHYRKSHPEHIIQAQANYYHWHWNYLYFPLIPSFFSTYFAIRSNHYMNYKCIYSLTFIYIHINELIIGVHITGYFIYLLYQYCEAYCSDHIDLCIFYLPIHQKKRLCWNTSTLTVDFSIYPLSSIIFICINLRLFY